ncbi:M78 family (ImmA) [Fructobacillus cardui]|nr:M78 family (ImmA) [Fructobacillus cardui]CAK1241809.1 M78 family (ImmA) [Fructobacillus cardui]
MKIEMPTSPMTFMEYLNVPSWLLDEVTTQFNELA